MLFICFTVIPPAADIADISRSCYLEHWTTSSHRSASHCAFLECSFCTTPGPSTRAMGSLNLQRCPLNPRPHLARVWTCRECLEIRPPHFPRGSISLTHSLVSESSSCLLTPTPKHVVPCERRYICLSESLISTNGNCPPHHPPQSDLQLRNKDVVQFILIYVLD